jgi:hypothetical protein
MFENYFKMGVNSRLKNLAVVEKNNSYRMLNIRDRKVRKIDDETAIILLKERRSSQSSIGIITISINKKANVHL